VDKVLKWIDADGTASDGATFCDAGCGVGSLAIPLAQRGAKVSASDISAAMAEEGRTRASAMGVENVEFSTSDLESIEGDYNTVCANLPSPAITLARRRAISRRGSEAVRSGGSQVTCIDVMIHYPEDKMSQMVSSLASHAEERLIISFAPNTWYYRALKSFGELFPGPSKTTRAYLHTEESVVSALEAAGFKLARTEVRSISLMSALSWMMYK
ncbi:MAG: hypothetical protein SGPRY_012758, partial [Prymnesium sp.]